MTDTNVFPDTTPATPEASSVAPPTINIPDQVKEWVGEGKKYATVEDALKSIPHAQRHIDTMKVELDTTKRLIEEAKAKQETYEAYLATQGQPPAQQAAPAIDPDNVRNLVGELLNERSREEVARNNSKLVQEALTKRFGEKAKEVYVARAQELGINLDGLARQSPQAVLELFPKGDTAPAPTPSGSINTAALSQNAPQKPATPIMFGADTPSLLSAWREAGKAIKQS